MIPYQRNTKAIIEAETDFDGHIVSEQTRDVCPSCGGFIIWSRECNQWAEDSDGVMQPDLWDQWHGVCGAEGTEFYLSDDGLAFTDEDGGVT